MEKKTEIPEGDKAVTAADIGVSPEQLEGWKKRYGDVIAIPVDDQWFVFKKPGWAAISRFFDTFADKKLSEANLNLVVDTLLWPAQEAFGRLMGENPFLPILLGNALQERYNVGAVGNVKNL